jgi:putative transposase
MDEVETEATAPRRRSLRLKGWDYSQSAAYFITLCVHNQACLLGAISKGKMQLSPAGSMITRIWLGMPEYNPGLVLDEYVVMPNHFHALLGLIDPNIGRGQCPAPTGTQDLQVYSQRKLSVPDVVRKFKTLSITEFSSGVRDAGWPPHGRHLWQRGYFDRVVRNEQELESCREYIFNNPLSWHLDRKSSSV